jgi:hypothetical protein
MSCALRRRLGIPFDLKSSLALANELSPSVIVSNDCRKSDYQ